MTVCSCPLSKRIKVLAEPFCATVDQGVVGVFAIPRSRSGPRRGRVVQPPEVRPRLAPFADCLP